MYINTISKIYSMSGSFCDDLIFPFFAIFLNRKLLNQQNLYSVSISIRRFIYRKKELTHIKNGSHFPHFSIVCDTQKKTGYADMH